MNEEKQPNFPDKYHLSRKESDVFIEEKHWNWFIMRENLKG